MTFKDARASQDSWPQKFGTLLNPTLLSERFAAGIAIFRVASGSLRRVQLQTLTCKKLKAYSPP